MDAAEDTFIADPHWPKLSEAYKASPYQVSGLALDQADGLLALTRGSNDWFPGVGFSRDLVACDPVLVLDKEEGGISGAWGKNTFIMPHQIRIDGEGSIWVVDCGAHKVIKFDKAYRPIMELGGESAGFAMPTDVAVAKDGDFFVADGYVNARVAHFDPAGKLISAWGEKGSAPREFRVPHSVVLDEDQNLYVADRDNDRIQIFDTKGVLQGIWSHIDGPSTLALSGGFLFVLSHLAAEKGIVRVVDRRSGKVVEYFHTKPPGANGDFEWPHGLAVGDGGNTVYLGYTLTGKRIQKFVRR